MLGMGEWKLKASAKHYASPDEMDRATMHQLHCLIDDSEDET